MRILACFLLSCPFAAGALAQMHGVTVDSGVRVKMRDGVTLAADIYRPKAAGKFPVLVERTPYNRASAAGHVSSPATGPPWR